MEWRIYYSDGSVYDSCNGEASESPIFGVICIVQPDDLVGRTILNRWDFYYFDGHSWSGCDIFGLIDRLCNDLPTHSLRQGRTMATAQYRQIMGKADKDPDFPPKSGKIAGEMPGIN